MSSADLPTSLASVRELMPEPTVQRLPWYLAYVSRLRSGGVERVSSTQIGKELNLDASQIAKDLSFLNIRGRTRIGYDVVELENALNDFLCFRRSHDAVMLGVGSLGASLIADRGLGQYGLFIVAGIDVDPLKVGHTTADGTPVYHLNELPEIVERLNCRIGILAVPPEAAQEVADSAVAAGIKALWNFTPHRLRPSAGVVIQDTSIYSSLALIYNRLELQNKEVDQ